MIEPTDEMVTAFMRAAAETPVQVAGRELLNARAGLAAVLAIVARDHCLERRGHVFHPLAKDQSPKWRCNRVTRCVLPDGHDGGHAYTGETR